MSPILVAFLAVCLSGVGIWGRRNASELVPNGVDAETQEHRIRQLRRGGLLCQVFAVVFVVGAVILAVFH